MGTLPTKLHYRRTLNDVSKLLEAARAASARTLNAVMTTTYFHIGRRIVEEEQRGNERADYGTALVERLAGDLKKQFGRGFGRRNLFQMRAFFLEHREIVQTPSAQSFPLPKEPLRTPALGQLGGCAALLRDLLPCTEGGPTGSSTARFRVSSTSAPSRRRTRSRC